MNKAIITGITGQDGSYLAENLLRNGSEVIGVKRRNSTNNTWRLKTVLGHPKFKLEEGDITDSSYVLFSLLNNRPTHVFNLAAQSHVATSFSQPFATFDVTGKAVLNYLEGIRLLNKSIRFYQASSSEMFGSAASYYDGGRQETLRVTKDIIDPFQDETTPFNPQSPYAIAKLAAHNLVKLYRESYGLFACSGILFNHESERRGDLFVTKKIANYVKNIRIQNGPHYLGNLHAYRDWGHAEDYVEAMRRILDNPTPMDFVVGTGKSYSVEDFAREAFNLIGKKYTDYVCIDTNLLRPSDVPYLRANAERAQDILGWAPKIDFRGLIRRMILDNTPR